jgi:hypothetical protein
MIGGVMGSAVGVANAWVGLATKPLADRVVAWPTCQRERREMVMDGTMRGTTVLFTSPTRQRKKRGE